MLRVSETQERVDLIGYACDGGARVKGAAQGPQWVQMAPRHAGARWTRGLAADHLQGPEQVYALVAPLAGAVSQSLRMGQRFLVLGGDHSSAVGTWSGVARQLRQPFGLIWLDAHLDAHVPETSPSGALHGMPLARLLGFGDPGWGLLGTPEPVLLPQHLIVIGARSYEPAEQALLQGLGVQVIYDREWRTLGVEQALHRAVRRLCERVAWFGISLDVDVLPPDQVPGTGTPARGGPSPQALVAALAQLPLRERLLGAEVSEFNPRLDRHGRTLAWVLRLIEALSVRESSHV